MIAAFTVICFTTACIKHGCLHDDLEWIICIIVIFLLICMVSNIKNQLSCLLMLYCIFGSENMEQLLWKSSILMHVLVFSWKHVHTLSSTN